MPWVLHGCACACVYAGLVHARHGTAWADEELDQTPYARFHRLRAQPRRRVELLVGLPREVVDAARQLVDAIVPQLGVHLEHVQPWDTQGCRLHARGHRLHARGCRLHARGCRLLHACRPRCERGSHLVVLTPPFMYMIGRIGAARRSARRA
jgi:hypothetical protein